MLTISRHRHGFIYSGYTPDMTVETRLHGPYGAPLFVGWDAEINDGMAAYRTPRAWQRECRVFVEQRSGVVLCRDRCVENLSLTRRLRVTGLDNATLRFFPDDLTRRVEMVSNGSYPFFEGPFAKPEKIVRGGDTYYEVTGVSGEIMIGW